jgi:hypothetical protein
VPALALNGVSFESVPNEVQRAAQNAGGEDDGDEARDDSSMSSSDEEMERVPEGITVRQPMGSHGRKNGTPPAESVTTSESAVTAVTTQITDPKEANTTPEEVPKKGVDLSREELLQQRTSFSFCTSHIVDGFFQSLAFSFATSSEVSLRRRLVWRSSSVCRGPSEMNPSLTRLFAWTDDGYWPAFSTIKPRSTHAAWEQIGEGFIKELDFGRVWLRLNENDEGDKDDIIAEWKGDAKDFLEKTLVSTLTACLVHPYLLSFSERTCNVYSRRRR